MKRQSIRLIPLLIIFLFSICLAGRPVQAGDGGNCGNGLTWSYSDGELSITGYGSMTEYNDFDKVPWHAYRGSVTSIRVEYGVLSLGRFCFYNMPNLKSVYLSNTVKRIGMQAFYKCSSLEQIALPNVLIIEEHAFRDCTSLQKITLPETLLILKANAFYNCAALSSLTIPTKARTIFEGAVFYGTNLKSVRFGPYVQQIGDYAFGFRGSPETLVPGFTITGTPGTQAEYYAKAKGIPFICNMNGLRVIPAKASYPYTGSEIKPEVTVMNEDMPVPAGSYTVTYTANKNVGTAKITVTGKGQSTGSSTCTFRILPKKTGLKKLTAKKKGFAASWSKIKGCADGYQLQAALNKTFKSGVKTYTIKGFKTVSKKITGLKAKKKYFVRIRTYKTLAGAKVWSEWSQVKAVTTK